MHGHLLSGTPVRCLLLGLALLSAGCVIHSEAPLSDPDKATPNDKLLGEWVSPSKDDPYTLTVTKAPAGCPPGVMTLSFPGNYVLFFSSDIKGKTYVNLCGGWVSSPEKLPTWAKARQGPFGIVKYAVEDDSVVLWSHDEPFLQDLVRRGKLKGTIQDTGGKYSWPTALLKESTANLAQFVLREDKKLFPTQGKFKRVK